MAIRIFDKLKDLLKKQCLFFTRPYQLSFKTQGKTLYVTGSGKTGFIVTMTDIHFLPVRESCTHALPRNTKYLIIVGQVCFYRRLFTDAVKPPGCISLPWRALIGLHGVPGCSSRQSWPPLWIVSVCATNWRHSTALWVWVVALTRLRLPTLPRLPPTPSRPPAHPL